MGKRFIVGNIKCMYVVQVVTYTNLTSFIAFLHAPLICQTIFQYVHKERNLNNMIYCAYTVYVHCRYAMHQLNLKGKE